MNRDDDETESRSRVDPTVDRTKRTLPDPPRPAFSPNEREIAPPPSDESLAAALRALTEDLRRLVTDAWIVARTYLDRFGIGLRSIVVRMLGATVLLVVVTFFLCACALSLLSSARGLALDLTESTWLADLLGGTFGFGFVATGAWLALRAARKSSRDALMAKYDDRRVDPAPVGSPVELDGQAPKKTEGIL